MLSVRLNVLLMPGREYWGPRNKSIVQDPRLKSGRLNNLEAYLREIGRLGGFPLYVSGPK